MKRINRLEHSLISPNQCRAEGNKIYDDPTSTVPMAIHHTVTTIDIPLVMNGVIAMVSTRVPTDDELSNCFHLHMTSDHPWDPQHPSLERGNSTFTSSTSTLSSFPTNSIQVDIPFNVPMSDRIMRHCVNDGGSHWMLPKILSRQLLRI